MASLTIALGSCSGWFCRGFAFSDRGRLRSPPVSWIADTGASVTQPFESRGPEVRRAGPAQETEDSPS